MHALAGVRDRVVVHVQVDRLARRPPRAGKGAMALLVSPVQSDRVRSRIGVDEHAGVGEVREVRVGDRERHRRVELVDRREVARSSYPTNRCCEWSARPACRCR